MTPFNTPGELAEEEIYERIKDLPIDQKTILVCHCPPCGYFDSVRGEKTGSTSLLRIIHEKEPLVFLCGHIHELEGVARIGKTTVIKIPAAMNGKVAVLNTGEEIFFPAKVIHSAKAGPHGCEYIHGERPEK